MGTQKTRKDKIEWFKNYIESFFKRKPTARIDKNKLIAEFALHNNSTKRTGEEILALLHESNYIKMNGMEIAI